MKSLRLIISRLPKFLDFIPRDLSTKRKVIEKLTIKFTKPIIRTLNTANAIVDKLYELLIIL